MSRYGPWHNKTLITLCMEALVLMMKPTRWHTSSLLGTEASAHHRPLPDELGISCYIGPAQNYERTMALYRTVSDIGFVVGPILLG